MQKLDINDNGTSRLRLRLEAKRAVDPDTGCWNWTGAKTSLGYGETSVAGRFWYIHRLAAKVYLGADLDRGTHVCHRCDNPGCFNPSHLFIGSARTNQLDSRLKGRTRVLRRRTTPDERARMRDLRAKGYGYREIAEDLDRSLLTVIRYFTNKTFREDWETAAVRDEHLALSA